MNCAVICSSNMETIETNLCTLSRHVLHDQTKHKEATGDLTLLLISIQLGCKFVSSLVRKAGLANLYVFFAITWSYFIGLALQEASMFKVKM